MMVDVPGVITYTTFGDDRLRGLGVTGGQILPFRIGFRRRPYNTLALPCECVNHTSDEYTYVPHKKQAMPARERRSEVSSR